MTVLIAWLWQGIAIACATAVVLALTPRLGAATRHALWWLTCAAVLVLPVAYAFVPDPNSAGPAATVAVAAAPDVLLPSLWLAWVLFATAALVRLLASIVAVFRLKAMGRAPDAVVASRLARSRAAHLLPHVRVSDRINGACALGLGSPVILLSRSLAARFDDEALAAIVLHEHAHLDRRDDWWQLLQAFVAACAGWHPAVWFIGRQIAIEREAACDDRVLGHDTDSREYARALVLVAELRHVWRGPERRLAIPGAAVSSSALRRRVVRLLDPRLDRSSRAGVGTRVAASMAMTLTVAVAARVPDLVAFEDVSTLLPAVERGVARMDLAHVRLREADVPRVKSRASKSVQRSLQLPQAPSAPASQLQVRESPLIQARAVVESRAVVAVIETPAVSGASAASADKFQSPVAPGDSPPGPWTTLGRSASTGGISIGRFFTRAARGIAGTF